MLTYTPVVVGVDSGGSKTVAVVGDTKGNVLGKGTAGAANPLSVGIERSLENIITAIKNGTAKIKNPEIVSLYIGTAGGWPKVLKDLKKAVKLTTLLRIRGELTVEDDLPIALHSGLPEGDGIVLIVGTGSAAYGVDKQGNKVHVSGWNHLLGETGGYELGLKSLIAATRSYDGRGEKTVLEDIVSRHFALDTFESLPLVIKPPFIDSPKIAALTPLVDQAAMDGDRVAKRLIEEMITEMDCSIRTAATRAGIEKGLRVVLVGSIFRMKYPVLEELKTKVMTWMKDVEFVFPSEEPAMTAFKFALKAARA
ncbi:MAG: BadF/BadG/BcrA/BcrD ATPase family protein [bacterium]|nr:BadF/BadG/BcrA/BcrD ATPase family protein [bacterium]